MGKEHEIIVGEKISPTGKHATGTVVRLESLKQRSARGFDKGLLTIARNIAERLLPYFITEEYICPDIILSEEDGSGAIHLNNFFKNSLSDFICEIEPGQKSFTLKNNESDEEFKVRIFKFYSSGSQKSSIVLSAHKREVLKTALHEYIPEFSEEFFEQAEMDGAENPRNYIVKAYVFAPYLDCNVSLERGGFKFKKEGDMFFGIGQDEIEKNAASIVCEAIGENITFRQEKKAERVRSYVEQKAPWHKTTLSSADLSGLSYRANDEEIEMQLQKEKFSQETAIKRDVARIMKETNLDGIKENVVEIINKISDTGQGDLVHYVALRKAILEIFEKSLGTDALGKYSSEGHVHDIIFPRKGDSDITHFDRHNLWMVDERLNFTTYISSDLPLTEESLDRPDLLVYNKRVLFRGGNEPSNPITIFEFKKPQRDDFVNPSSEDDPIQQIVRYANKIKDGKYKTSQGRSIKVAETTPFYGYVVCSITPKVAEWLERTQDFTPMPDRNGWFGWKRNINLYIEVLDWEKVLDDAKMRNAIFFNKLGIQ